VEYTTKGGDPLSYDQIEAIGAIEGFKGRSVILTGPAGSGKSEVVKYLLRTSNKYAVCSTTARSALLVGGCTVDRVFCFSRDDWEIWSGQYLGRVMNGMPDNIIIDEASMIGHNMARVIREVAEAFNKTIIMVGDWAQAQPVNEDWPFDDELFGKAEVLKLTTNHRQALGEYLTGLNYIREGQLNQHATDIFTPCIARNDQVDERAVRIFSTNAEVSNYNKYMLRKYCSESGEIGFGCLSYVQDFTGKMDEQRKTQLIDTSGFAHKASFAIGCRAMIVRNADKDCPNMFVNGDTGVIMDAVYEGDKRWSTMDEAKKKSVWKTTPKYVRMKLDRGPLISVPPMRALVQDALHDAKQAVTGIPLALGYAYTVHKTQGMTIPKIFVGMNSILNFPGDSRHGLAYVAMSRTPELSGLSLDLLDSAAVHCDPTVLGLVEGGDEDRSIFHGDSTDVRSAAERREQEEHQ
jgi:hypothetical protein